VDRRRERKLAVEFRPPHVGPAGRLVLNNLGIVGKHIGDQRVRRTRDRRGGAELLHRERPILNVCRVGNVLAVGRRQDTRAVAGDDGLVGREEDVGWRTCALCQQLIVARSLAADVEGQRGAGLLLEFFLRIGLDSILGDSTPRRHGECGAARNRGRALGTRDAGIRRGTDGTEADDASSSDELPTGDPTVVLRLLHVLVPCTKNQRRAYRPTGKTLCRRYDVSQTLYTNPVLRSGRRGPFIGSGQ